LALFGRRPPERVVGIVDAGVRKPCMGPWKSSREFTACYFSFNPISLFDLKAHFFAPTRIVQTLSRGGAVKVGRHSDIFSCSGDARPYLDSSEHGSTLVVVGMTSRGEPACRARTFVPQPCIRWAAMTRTMMQSCASAAKLRGGGPILHNGMKAMVFAGPRHLEPSSAIPHVVRM